MRKGLKHVDLKEKPSLLDVGFNPKPEDVQKAGKLANQQEQLTCGCLNKEGSICMVHLFIKEMRM